MLSQSRKPVCLSLVSFDMPIWSSLETSATLYQKTPEQFHVLLTEPAFHHHPSHSSPWTTPTPASEPASAPSTPDGDAPRLLWLEISPQRVTMTMQGNGRFSYRHYWEQGTSGVNRYWLQGDRMEQAGQMRLRNFTRSLALTGGENLEQLRLEYQLWSQRLCLGHYVMNLEIH
ncbi:MAG: hypothetical protein F6K30_14325 [Cyanothece sp. SIO2G6]|nr:hypothetical protein [Cyanothece sp. SIO2G6]